MRRRFAWTVPQRLNWATRLCVHAADAPAVVVPVAPERTMTFGALDSRSSRLANLLVHGEGLVAGDRVAILLGQRPTTAVAHVALAKAALVALPLFRLFGPDALSYRLADSGARVLITDRDGAERVAPIRADLRALRTVYSVDGGTDGAEDLAAAMARAGDRFTPCDTAAEDPATLIYTSGTTGAPKGAVLPHRVLPGHLPGVEYPHWPFPSAGDRFWTPADWAWIGGLYDVLLPALWHGVAVVAQPPGKFDPETAFALIARERIRNAFLPPTALKLMRAARPDAPAPGLRSVGSGGEALGEEIRAWGRQVLGVPINEFYGQTECNLVVASSAGLGVERPGAIGRAVPGHSVAVIDDAGDPLPPGTLGEIAVRRPDPVMFTGYWNRPEETAAKFVGAWLRTGDSGTMDADGYIAFAGRTDDVINSAGYRIGPTEVEDCLLRHPAVAMAAVVGAPDPTRGEVVAAFVVLRPAYADEPGLAGSVQDFVRARLAAHAYPRVVRFVPELPMTATGKIVRRLLRERLREGEASDAPKA
ncbi:MAG: AMP-binding protein [Alphaproteobacteria bacterium]